MRTSDALLRAIGVSVSLCVLDLCVKFQNTSEYTSSLSY